MRKVGSWWNDLPLLQKAAFIALGLVIVLGASLNSDDGTYSGSSPPSNTDRDLTRCEAAFAAVSRISDFQDTQDDIEATFFACDTLAEWKDASARYKISGSHLDPVYVQNQCKFNKDVKTSPLC